MDFLYSLNYTLTRAFLGAAARGGDDDATAYFDPLFLNGYQLDGPSFPLGAPFARLNCLSASSICLSTAA